MIPTKSNTTCPAIMAAAAVFRSRARRNFRREKIFRDRTNPLDTFDDCEIISRYRFTRQAILDLCEELDMNMPTFDARGGSVPLDCTCKFALLYVFMRLAHSNQFLGISLESANLQVRVYHM